MAARKRRVRKESPANVQLLEKIRALKGDHPSWGYKRITAWLRRREHMKANHKRVLRLHYPPGQFLFGFPRLPQGRGIRADTGFGRIEPGQHFYNLVGGVGKAISIYLPSRNAIALECLDGIRGSSGPEPSALFILHAAGRFGPGGVPAWYHSRFPRNRLGSRGGSR